jgi:hypothetical protein
MSERRFSETEVSAIFMRAASVDHQRAMPSVEGSMTMGDLLEIGGEVGLAPEAIAEAVSALESTEPIRTRGFLGLPLRVEYIVALDKPLSDAEWGRTVVCLRDVFDVPGAVKSDGGLRQWINGNLQVLVEPSGVGQRLRLRTFKGNAIPLMAVGLGMAGAAGAALAAQVLAGAASANLVVGLSLLAGAGASLLAATALRLPPWAQRRREQMSEVTRRVVRMQLSSGRGSVANELPAAPPVKEPASGV